jgi:hypothetical protein
LQQALVVPRRDRLLRDKNNESIVASDLDAPRELFRYHPALADKG